jgi:hypothetical protein
MSGLLIFLVLLMIELFCLAALQLTAILKERKELTCYQKDLLTWQLTITKRYVRIERVLFPNFEIYYIRKKNPVI